MVSGCKRVHNLKPVDSLCAARKQLIFCTLCADRRERRDRGTEERGEGGREGQTD